MRYTDFLEWLKTEKGMNIRSARDVISRSKRALGLTKQPEIDEESMQKLVDSIEYHDFSSCIKSQLKRSITLYQEFTNYVQKPNNTREETQ